MTETSKLFRDLLTETKDGDWGKGEPHEGYVPAHVIRGTDFSDVRLGKIANVPLRFLAEKTVHRRLLRADDILIETAGGSRDRPTGRTLLITQEVLDTFPNSVTCASFARFLRVNPLLVNPRYIYWYLQYLYMRGDMWVHQVQHTGVARFQFTRFAESEEVPLIPRAEQDGIATILGMLDDKIAVNERITTTALDLAEAHFCRAVDQTEFGDETFGSVAVVSGGGTPSTKVEDYWNGSIAWATPSDVTALASPYLFETERKITDLGLENCASQLYPAKSIFMTSRATIGAFALPQIPAAVNQGFIVVVPPNADMRWWLFHEMRSRVDEMVSLANGSTFLELSRKNFKAMRVRLPAAADVADFARTVAPLHAAATHASRESRQLTTLRDTLLPQLMSGRLRVRDAEKIVEDAT
ncbi:restriction endonuclease subunit S [Sphaerimonospora mesophila]|uniref:restriction endonuclease subunit S n=1 Tax=Sphaerimonospora mesophila TaxID=37483 RepID=UPI000AC20B5C